MLRFLTPTPFNVDDFLIQINILLLLTGGGGDEILGMLQGISLYSYVQY